MATTIINCPHCDAENESSKQTCDTCGQSLLIKGIYKLEEILWHSAINRTYRAHSSLRTGREVILQEYLIPANEHTERSLNELDDNVERLVTLSHAGLPRIVDHFRGNPAQGSRANSYYLALEGVEGQTLEERHREKGTGRLPPSDVIPWALTLIDTLEYLHGQTRRFFHGDIRPGTLKLASTGQVSFIDYGIGLIASLPAIEVNRNVTPGYSPIEQYQGNLDLRADIYSTGALLYFLMGGVTPVEATARVDRQLLTLRQVVPGFPGAIDQVVLYALRVEVYRRYQSAHEMKKALRQAGQQNTARNFLPPAVGRATVEAETKRMLAAGGAVNIPHSGTGGGIAAVNRATVTSFEDGEEEDEMSLPTRNRTVGVPGAANFTQNDHAQPTRTVVVRRRLSNVLGPWLIGLVTIIIVVVALWLIIKS